MVTSKSAAAPATIESRTIVVTNLSPTTDEASLRKFFSFCGTIQSISNEEKGKAVVIFEKGSAAQTASFLSQGTLDGSTIHVTTSESDSAADELHSHGAHDIAQEDKPRAAVAAEILAHGYVLSDHGIQKAIDLDTKYGVSTRFLAWFKPLSEKMVTKAQKIDANRGISQRATTLAADTDAKLGATSKASLAIEMSKNYYSSALHSTVGAKFFKFYTDTAKQVVDVHEEARRIADSRKAAAAAPAPPAQASVTAATTEIPPAAPKV